MLLIGDTSGIGPHAPAASLARRGDGRPQLLHEKRGRPLNQPVGRHDANDIGDGHVQPVK